MYVKLKPIFILIVPNSLKFSQIFKLCLYFVHSFLPAFERISTHGRGVWTGMWSMLRLSPDISPPSIMCACDQCSEPPPVSLRHCYSPGHPTFSSQPHITAANRRIKSLICRMWATTTVTSKNLCVYLINMMSVGLFIPTTHYFQNCFPQLKHH